MLIGTCYVSYKEILPTLLLGAFGVSTWLIFSSSFAMVPIRNVVGSGFELDKSTVILALTFRSDGSSDFDLVLLFVTVSNRIRDAVISIFEVK